MKLLHRILCMQALPWALVMFTLRLSCALLFCAFLVGAYIEDAGLTPHRLHLMRALWELPQALLLLGGLGSVLWEDALDQGR